MTLIKHISSFILPLTVLVIVPYSIESEMAVHTDLLGIAGIPIGVTGLCFMYYTISSFVKIGKGTLAPWAPTKHLVVTGLYRYMRNPMITGVLFLLIGESLVFHSINIAYWAVAFIVINTVYFIQSEEPGLEKRFGAEYREYKKHVNRWIPRLTPYELGEIKNDGQSTTNS